MQAARSQPNTVTAQIRRGDSLDNNSAFVARHDDAGGFVFNAPDGTFLCGLLLLLGSKLPSLYLYIFVLSLILSKAGFFDGFLSLYSI